MSPGEQLFFWELQSILAGKYLIFPQVKLDGIIEPTSPLWELRQPIMYKSVDFVIVDKRLITKLVIELDDKTHLLVQRQDRDVLINNVLKDAGIKIYHQKQKYRYNRYELANTIKEILKIV